MSDYPILKSKYEVTDLLSEDLVSFCYLGRHIKTKALVHIWKFKSELVTPELVRRLIPMAEKVIDIQDTRVLKLLDYAYDGKFFYTIYESFKEMVTLETFIKDKENWDLKSLWRITTQLLSVMIKVESKRLVCGSLNLNGIYMLPSGDIKLAKIALPIEFMKVGWNDFELVEDCLFYPPEFVQYQIFDSRSDMYSLGVLMYLFFSKRWPYAFTLNISQLRKSFLEGITPFKKSQERVPDRLRDIVEKCLALDAGNRFFSFAVLVKSYRGDVDFQPLKTEGADTTTIQHEIKQDMKQTIMKKVRSKLFVIVMSVAIVFLSIFSYTMYVNYLTAIPELAVPELVGMDLQDAERVLEAHALSAKVVGTRAHPFYEEGEVVESKPPAGRLVKQNRVIRLFVSRGEMPVLVPDLVGRKKDNVLMLLEDRGVRVDVLKEIYSVQYAEGIVVGQIPTPNTFITPSDNIHIILSKGFPIELEIKKTRFSFFNEKEGVRRVELKLFVLDNWEQQRVDVYYTLLGEKEKLYSAVHMPGDTLKVDFDLEVGGRLDVYFNDDRAYSKDITDQLETIKEGD